MRMTKNVNREVLIFLHMDDEHPGFIANFLQHANIQFRIIRSYKKETIPPFDNSMMGLVFMGGIMSANDEIGWIKDAIKLIGQALEHNVPILGHCLGGQLISKALGETVSKNPDAEIGWHDCYRTKPKIKDGWLDGIKDPFTMFHWHYESFSVPMDAEPLFSSVHCKNQAYSYGNNVLAMQCHVEMTLPLISNWINSWKDDLTIESASQQSYTQISEDLERKVSELNLVASSLYTRWVSTLTI